MKPDILTHELLIKRHERWGGLHNLTVEDDTARQSLNERYFALWQSINDAVQERRGSLSLPGGGYIRAHSFTLGEGGFDVQTDGYEEVKLFKPVPDLGLLLDEAVVFKSIKAIRYLRPGFRCLGARQAPSDFSVLTRISNRNPQVISPSPDGYTFWEVLPGVRTAIPAIEHRTTPWSAPVIAQEDYLAAQRRNFMLPHREIVANMQASLGEIDEALLTARPLPKEQVR